MTQHSRSCLESIWSALSGDGAVLSTLESRGNGDLPSTFAVTDLATASISCAALAITELIQTSSQKLPTLRVDRRLSSFWFALSIRPTGWAMSAPWDPIAGDYRAADGWIRLHTNAPHHRAAAEKVLGQRSNKSEMAAAVASWNKSDLEQAVVEAGGCAAEMRSMREWREHPQGMAVNGEPLMHLTRTQNAGANSWRASATRPLAGLCVLDLTRVLAGPVASRFLAGYGADVLRIDPPTWDEPGVIPEVTLGKRCARLDLRQNADRNIFESLVASADILLHGLRADALDRLGYSAEARAKIRPGLIDVCLNAYGWSGPWMHRRGFDSLVQMSAGIADAGLHWKKSDQPVPLPVQALDQATGYLMAAAAIRGVTQRVSTGYGLQARLSLARTAALLCDMGLSDSTAPLAPETPADLSPTTELTSWGPAQRLHPPVVIDAAPMHWDRPATALGSASAAWL